MVFNADFGRVVVQALTFNIQVVGDGRAETSSSRTHIYVHVIGTEKKMTLPKVMHRYQSDAIMYASATPIRNIFALSPLPFMVVTSDFGRVDD